MMYSMKPEESGLVGGLSECRYSFEITRRDQLPW